MDYDIRKSLIRSGRQKKYPEYFVSDTLGDELTDILKDGKSGDGIAEIRHIDVDGFAAIRNHIVPGRYVQLLVNGKVTMANTQTEKVTNREFVKKAYGDVLIGGLGLGMIILGIQDKSEVTSITVIEKYRQVIDLVAGQLPLNSKVRIIEGDVFTYEPDRQYDTVYMDIWGDINHDIYKKEMKPLLHKFRKNLKKGRNSWCSCWAYKNVKWNKPLL